MPQRSVVYHLIPSKQCRFKGNWCFLKQRHQGTQKPAVLSWLIHANAMIFGRFWLPHWGNKTSFMGPWAHGTPSAVPQSVWLSPRASWGFLAPENGELWMGEPQVGPQRLSHSQPIPSALLSHGAVDACEILHQVVDGKHPISIPLFTVFHRNPNSYQRWQDFAGPSTAPNKGHKVRPPK